MNYRILRSFSMAAIIIGAGQVRRKLLMKIRSNVYENSEPQKKVPADQTATA